MEPAQLMQEALKSSVDALTGKLRCQACGKVLANHATLAQHLKDKHQGHNRPDAPSSAGAAQQMLPGRGTHTLGDVLAASMASRQHQQAQPGTSVGGLPAGGPRGAQSAPRNLKELREYLKNAPKKVALAAAVHKRLGGVQKKKRLSLLKRIILRERASKAVEAATATLEAARAHVQQAAATQSSIQAQLQQAEKLQAAPAEAVPGDVTTQVQVLNMALLECQRQCREAARAVTEAEAALQAREDEQAQLSAPAHAPEASDGGTDLLPPADTAAASSAAASSAAASSAAAGPAASRPAWPGARQEQQAAADKVFVEEQLRLFGLGPDDAASDSDSSDTLSDGGGGLDAFEDVLASWMTSAQSQAAKTLQRIHDASPGKHAAAVARDWTAVVAANQAATDAAPLEEDSGTTEGDQDFNLEAWDDVLSNWMVAAGTTEGGRFSQAASAPTSHQDTLNVVTIDPVSQQAGTTSSQADQAAAAMTMLQGSADFPPPSSLEHPLLPPRPSLLAHPPTTSGPMPSNNRWFQCVVPSSQLQLSHGLPFLGGNSSQPHRAATLGQVQSTSDPATASGQQLPLARIQSRPVESRPGAQATPSWLEGVSSDEEGGAHTPRPAAGHRASSRLSSDSAVSSSIPALEAAGAGDAAAMAGMLHAGVAASATLSQPQMRGWGNLQMSGVPATPLGAAPQQAAGQHVWPRMLGQPEAAQLPVWSQQLTGSPGFVPQQQPHPGALQNVAAAAAAALPLELQQQLFGMEGAYAGAFLNPMLPPAPERVHDFHCRVCKVTCCGIANFEQHCSSKRHLRKAALEAASITAAAAGAAGGRPAAPPEHRGTTYMGRQAQCRNYCKQVITAELNHVVVELLQQLLFWQERAKAQDPLKAAKRKRLVSGLREVAKAVKLGKAKSVVVAPNIDQIETEGGLDDLLGNILGQAEQAGLPVVFALTRKKMGQVGEVRAPDRLCVLEGGTPAAFPPLRVFGCRKKMSSIAILDYGGANELYAHMQQLAQQGRLDFQRQASEMGGLVPQQQQSQVPLQPQDIDWGDGAASLSNSSETRSLVEQQGALSASSASRHGGEVPGAAAAGMSGGQGDARFAAGGMMGSMGPSQPAGGSGTSPWPPGPAKGSAFERQLARMGVAWAPSRVSAFAPPGNPQLQQDTAGLLPPGSLAWAGAAARGSGWQLGPGLHGEHLQQQQQQQQQQHGALWPGAYQPSDGHPPGPSGNLQYPNLLPWPVNQQG